MRNRPLGLTCLISFVFAVPALAQQLSERNGEIKYISKETYYVNVGKKQGLSVGDTLKVKRSKREIAALLVEHVARLSAACRLISQESEVRVGDQVAFLVRTQETTLPQQTIEEEKRPKETQVSDAVKSTTVQRNTTQQKSAANRIRGRVGLQVLRFDDRGNANLDYSQVAMRTKLTVQRFLGMPLEFRMRWRSRAHHRDVTLGEDIPSDEWTHNVYELGFAYENGASPVQFGFGRMLSRHILGLGYIDGGLFSIKMNPGFRVGIAGGTEPSLRSSAFRTDEQKFGIFLNYEKGEFRTQRLSSTIAFSGRYNHGQPSREFVYLQNNFWIGAKFSVYQTVEVDLNRGWKNDNGQGTLQSTNFYITTHYRPVDFVTFTLSYDARKNIRVYETRSIPDSLFDAATRQGLHAGIVLGLPYQMRLSGNLGIRLRPGDLNNTISASSALTVRHPFNTWATLNLRFFYFSTMFTKGYRPNMNLRIPVLSGLSVNLGGGSYIYQTGNLTSKSHWLEMNGTYRINRWLYSDVGYRLFFDDRLSSGRFYVETGVAF